MPKTAIELQLYNSIKNLFNLKDKILKANKEKLNQTIVIDAGIADEDDLNYLKSKQYHYMAVSRKKIKDYEKVEAQSKIIQLTDSDKKKVALLIW